MSYHEPGKVGFWGPVTSTLDWCEINYERNAYIAEYWNTISNVFMFVPTLIGVLFLRGVEPRFVGCYLSLALVGFGSWAFHMTLLYSMQLADELPMIWGTAILIYALVELDQPPRFNAALASGLVLYCSVVTVVYLLLRTPLIHQAAYGTMVVICMFCATRVILLQRHIANATFFLLSCATYLLGFILWNVDTLTCPHLRRLRAQMSPTWAPLVELHAWWHLLAGLGTYMGLLVTIDVRLKILKQKSRIAWLGPLPVIRRDLCNEV